MIQPAAREAWHELEERLRPFVARRVQRPADADDVLQDVLLRLYTGLPNLRDEQRLGPWVYQVARNAITDHRRRVARQSQQPCQDVEDAEQDVSEEEFSAESVMAAYVGRFVALLPSPYREALTLTELEGLAQKDAAEMLAVSLSCLKSRVQRGRALLREAFHASCMIALDARGRVLSCEPRPTSRARGCSCEAPSTRRQ